MARNHHKRRNHPAPKPPRFWAPSTIPPTGFFQPQPKQYPFEAPPGWGLQPQPKPHSRPPKSHVPKTCTHCNKKGHTKRDCRDITGAKTPGQNKNESKRPCKHCRRKHSDRECHHPTQPGQRMIQMQTQCRHCGDDFHLAFTCPLNPGFGQLATSTAITQQAATANAFQAQQQQEQPQRQRNLVTLTPELSQDILLHLDASIPERARILEIIREGNGSGEILFHGFDGWGNRRCGVRMEGVVGERGGGRDDVGFGFGRGGLEFRGGAWVVDAEGDVVMEGVGVFPCL